MALKLGTPTINWAREKEKYMEGQTIREELENYFHGLWPGMDTEEQCNTDLHFTPPAIFRLAKHFYEFGKKA